jgi:hypothetical protein
MVRVTAPNRKIQLQDIDPAGLDEVGSCNGGPQFTTLRLPAFLLEKASVFGVEFMKEEIAQAGGQDVQDAAQVDG